MYKTSLTAALLLLSLTGCVTYERVSCPAPPPSLLVAEPPLDASRSLPEPIPLPVAIETWASDIGRFEALRSRHTALQGWWLEQCSKVK